LPEELDQRHGASEERLIVGVDASYTNKTVLKKLPERTTLIGRIRKDAALFELPRPQDQAPAGRHRQYGLKAPTPEELRQMETVPWREVSAFASGQIHQFRVKTRSPLLWQAAGSQCPLRLVVTAPVGYRLRKRSKLLYRQPAFAVASYAMLLIAGARTFGTDLDHGSLPLPKWQANQPRQHLSTQELIQQLRSEVWAYGISRLTDHSEPFVTPVSAITKCPESQLPAISALLYAGTG
jgi:hypothetical protein